MSTTSRIVWEKDGKEMILIPSGEFTMGCDEGPERCRPAHSVHVDAFYIDRYPVTNEEYKRFADDVSHPVPYYSLSWCDTRDYNWDPQTRMFPEGKARHPVVLVTWQDALAYANWAGKRLPTEAEWERAARGVDGRLWPWGNDKLVGRTNTLEAGLAQPSEIDQYSPEGDSPDGVGGMIGNVWEWTSSLFMPYPYEARDGREDLERMGWRVLRGGSHLNDLDVARCYARLDGDFVLFNNVGFRCAATP
ncbi:MAG: SUMF1/EgtB/PvdO family nonheme iron enzyme [Thermoflexales bacterium]|nr:SUMF1/EgtB/PvdO family nonheme iron enzyme [Thermoflexales bacterium]